MKLTLQEKNKIIKLIEAGKTLPAVYKSKLFDRDGTEFIEATKDYRLVYQGKARKEDIIAQTPAAPFQMIRSFCQDNPFEDGWKNMLIFGDNLLALKTMYEDQRGENRYKTKNKIKLIYIDPPFATKQDFMKDREKAYRDKIIGAQFIEFLRKRLILLREILADDGSIYVHLDWKKGHYIKAIMDEVFGEHNFVNEICWVRSTNPKGSQFTSQRFDVYTDAIFYYRKSDQTILNLDEIRIPLSTEELKNKYKYRDKKGRYYDGPIIRSVTMGPRPTMVYEYNGYTPGNYGWRVTNEKLREIDENGDLGWTSNKKPFRKLRPEYDKGKPIGNFWNDISLHACPNVEDQKASNLLKIL